VWNRPQSSPSSQRPEQVWKVGVRKWQCRDNISYICVLDKVELKLLKFNQKERPSKTQKNSELLKLSKTNIFANPNKGTFEVAPFERELTIPEDVVIWLDAAKTREAMKKRDLEQVLLAVAWVRDVQRRLFQLFTENDGLGIQLKKQTVRSDLCFLPVERTETTVVSRTYGHLCQANPCGFSLGFTSRQCQLY
jgi:hypothetical protein